MRGFFDENIVVEAWFAPEVQPLGWFDVNLLNTSSGGSATVRPITIDHTQVSGSHTDFTVYFFGTYAELKTTANGGLVANVNGYDVGFFSDSACTTSLKWEIVLYNASTGKYFYKIKIPTGVNSTTDKVFYIRYGDASITTDQSDKVNAYDSATQLVMGLGDGTTLSLSDSTTTPITAVNNGATATSGFINGAASFVAASSQYIELTDPTKLQITGQLEVSFWVNFTSLSGLQNIITKYGFNENYLRINGGSLEVGCYDGSDHATSYGGLSTATDYFIQGYYDGSNWKIDVNGANVASTATATGSLATGDQWAIGAGRYGAWGRFLNAIVSEVKISNAARSTGWHYTEYNNISSQATFITIGAALGGGGTSVSTNVGQLILNGFAPIISLGINSQLGQLTLNGFAPSVNISVVASSQLGQLTLTGFSPTITLSNNQIVLSNLGQLTLNGFSPTINVSNNQNILSSVGVLALTGFAPVIDSKINTAVGQLTLNGFSPTINVSNNQNIAVGLGELTINGYAPSTVANNNTVANVGVGILTINGFAPIVTATNSIRVSANLGQLTLNGLSPTINISQSAVTSTGQLLLSGFAPTINATANQNINAGVGQLLVNGFSPSAVVGSSVVTSTGQLVLVGYEPTITFLANTFVYPSFGELLISGFSPRLRITTNTNFIQPDTINSSVINQGTINSSVIGVSVLGSSVIKLNPISGDSIIKIDSDNGSVIDV
jgi:hypothetical protein